MQFQIGDVVYCPYSDRIFLVVGWAAWLKKNVYQYDELEDLVTIEFDDFVKIGEL